MSQPIGSIERLPENLDSWNLSQVYGMQSAALSKSVAEAKSSPQQVRHKKSGSFPAEMYKLTSGVTVYANKLIFNFHTILKKVNGSAGQDVVGPRRWPLFVAA